MTRDDQARDGMPGEDQPAGHAAAAAADPTRRHPTTDHAPLLERLFATPPPATEARCTVDDGLPEPLDGTYVVNGPARFSRGAQAYQNWLDGDGYVAAVRFGRSRPSDDGAGTASFTGSFVHSRKWVDEEAAGRTLYRTFGTSFPGDRLARTGLASPVNVSVYPFAGKLLAFGEQGLPWSLDPVTLVTRGEEDFGRLSAITPFSAHPAFDVASGEMWNFGISFAADRPLLQLFAFNADGTLRERWRLPLPHPYSVHDFALSPRFVAFHLAPYLLDVGALLATGANVIDSLHWRPELGSRLLVVARATGGVVLDLALPGASASRYCLHHVNAWEDGDRLVLELLELEEPVYPDYQVLPDLFEKVAPSHPVRLVVDLAAGRIVERQEIPYALAADFPAHHPARRGRRCRQSFHLAITATGRPGRKFFDQLVALDWDTMAVEASWTAPPGIYLGGEPVVVPGTAGDWVLCQEHDPQRGTARLLVFAASSIAAGPCTAVSLPHPIPPGFHATWMPTAVVSP
jgi:all-trans-8'-apo-beta-carotenal 15,15'-oxygenase